MKAELLIEPANTSRTKQQRQNVQEGNRNASKTRTMFGDAQLGGVRERAAVDH